MLVAHRGLEGERNKGSFYVRFSTNVLTPEKPLSNVLYHSVTAHANILGRKGVEEIRGYSCPSFLCILPWRTSFV